MGERIENHSENWGISDGSTIYPRDVFDRQFRMVEDFAFGSSYLEFGALLYKNGWKSRCVPGALVEHYAAVLRQPDPASIVFASLCFNLYFRPNLFRFCRCLAPHLPATNDVTAYGVKKAVENLPQLRDKLSTVCDNYLGSLRYDLRKLRAKDLVEKLPKSRRYRLRPQRYSIYLVFLKLFERVYSPLTAGLLQP